LGCCSRGPPAFECAGCTDDLESQLDGAKAEADDLKRRLADAQAQAQAQAVELATLHERLTATEQNAKATADQHAAALAQAQESADRLTAERDAARQEANLAREEAAKQVGKLEALAAQNAELLSALKARK
jgi:colicin import membrane protein